MTLRHLVAGLGLALAAIASAAAAELKIGVPAPITTLDPQFYVIGSNSAMARNLFDGLINQGDHQQLEPALATDWRAVDATTWEFHLRPGVKFHDGAPLEAEDVAASLRRVPTIANSPSSFLPYVKAIQAVAVVDPLTVRITTAGPTPLLPNNLSRIAILPRSGEHAPSDAFDKPGGVAGTGPFKLAEYVPGDHVRLVRNDAWWGPKPAWEAVTIRFVPNDSARVTALLAGDLDLIESVPSTALARLRGDARFAIARATSNRVMYLHLDSDRARSPFVTAKDGSPIDNPMRDARVRRALSLAINRQALVDRIMDGEGVATGQLVPEGYFGHVDDLPAPAFDLGGARKLLAEAGVPDGFGLTLHASNDRYPNDEKQAQAIAQMLTRAGVATKVVTQPGAVFFTRASKLEYSLILGGAAAETGEASSVLRPLLESFDPAVGSGTGNRGRYSSPEFDRLLRQALATVDDAARADLLQKATRLAMGEQGVIPLFFLVNDWAMRKDLRYQARSDGYTLAAGVAAAP